MVDHACVRACVCLSQDKYTYHRLGIVTIYFAMSCVNCFVTWHIIGGLSGPKWLHYWPNVLCIASYREYLEYIVSIAFVYGFAVGCNAFRSLNI